MFRFKSYRSKLQTAFLLLGLLAIGVTGWEASEGATGALGEATRDRLTAIRETRGRQIERYIDDVGNHVLALSSDESTVTALERFIESWDAVPAAPLDAPRTQALEHHYQSAFSELLAREPSVQPFLDEWFPDEPRTRQLQHLFIAANPYPLGSRFHLLAAPESGDYSRVHAQYHPTLHRYLSAFGFYDIFLIEAGEGRILYTVMKEVDLGTRLSRQPYIRTALARAWERAMALPEPETFVVEDYSPYLPSYLAPAAFVAAPIYRAGSRIGVLAIQLSIADINRVMTGDRKWAEEGLGQTGQSYIVGSDGTLRSDVRHEIERPEEFYRLLQRAGTTPEVVDRIRRYRTAVLNLRVNPDQHKAGPATGMAVDFRGVRVLRSEAPLDLPGLAWTIVAEIEAEEAFAPVAALRWKVLWQGLVITALLFVAARILSDKVTRPVLSLAASARRLGQRDFGVRLPVESDDEIGQLALSFNRMAEDLERTTVSRQELDRMLNSLINAVFVVEAGRDTTVDAVLQSRIRQSNRAAFELLHYSGDDLAGLQFRDVLHGDAAGWHQRIARVLERGVLPAAEAALVTHEGRCVPVLFSASWLAEESGKETGIVCVAQDITDWKATQDKLRRMSKVFMDATDPIVVTDIQGKIADCNAEAARMYGWSATEMEGHSITILFPEQQRDALAGLMERCLRGEAIRNAEMAQMDREGREIPTLVTLSLLTGEGGEAAGVAAIAKDISDRKQAERALRQKQQELEILTGRLIAAQEDERRRLARELHDDLTQRLAAVAIEAGRLERIPEAQEDRRRAAIERIKYQMAELSKDVHGLSRRLHPSTLDDLGIVAAIESECRAFFERGGTPVEFSSSESFDALPKEMQLGLYRIVQEGLRNISRHADADEVRIRLDRVDGHVRLEICDNGHGFDRFAPGWHAGIGLASMEERTRLLGGRFCVSSARGKGTKIMVEVPSGDTSEEAQNPAG